jgi:V-type H+-transporting ATPase subunit a
MPNQPMRRRTSNPGALTTSLDAMPLLSSSMSSSLARRMSGPNLASLAGPSASGRRNSAPFAAVFRSLSRPRAPAIGSHFRSEKMALLRAYFDSSAAHSTVDELGELGLVQFNDLNESQSPFQRAYSNNVRRCDEMLRVIRFLVDQVNAIPGLLLAPTDENAAAAASSIRLDDLDAHLQALERTLLELGSNADTLVVQYNQTCELRQVLDRSASFFRDAPSVKPPQPPSSRGSTTVKSFICELADIATASNNVEGNPGLLSFLTGTIERSKVASFERLLFRVTHGNCIVRFSEITEILIDPETHTPMEKTVFMVFFAGNAVRVKIAKICDAFAANRYSVPDDHATQMIALDQCHTRLADLKAVSSVTDDQRRQSLLDVADNVMTWRAKIKREMGIFHSLNLLNYDTSSRLFIAEMWCPVSAQDSVREALDIGRRRSNAQVPSVVEVRQPAPGEKPPTYFKTNKFTAVFQAIVESYGIARYQEVNPAPYTIITFPFLFAVMFGDIGHGILMAGFAMYLVKNEVRLGSSRRKLNEMMRTCYDGRYLILLMGIFSIFTGFIYNEFFALPLDLFGSRWMFTPASPMACGTDNCANPARVLAPLNPYPFGFDPVWKASKTGLVFFNSYKMKLSIVLGVCQMVMGICLSFSNGKFLKKRLDVLHVCVPQMIFMNAIFGYLVFLILFKWCQDFDSLECVADPNCLAPDLKSVLIDMFMSPGKMPADMVMFAGQNEVQVVLLVAALISVPWMLLPKPLILRARHMSKKIHYNRIPSNGHGADSEYDVEDKNHDGDDDHGHSGAFDFGELFVHQMIHTIEFVLGAVSNTASYLRLWALSLAHAELSNVFLEKLLFGPIATGNSVLMVIGFAMFCFMTLGVLMFMESLSAFLHALRLHWVEFQNKFYLLSGDGRKFAPFSHLSASDNDDEDN